MSVQTAALVSSSPLVGEGRGGGDGRTFAVVVPSTPHPSPQGGAEAAMIPESAPFSVEQRAWLNGFFAGLLSLDAKAGATALDGAMPDAAAKALAGDDDGAPWHDAAMPIAERMTLADGKPLPRQSVRGHGAAGLRPVRLPVRDLLGGHRLGAGAQAQSVRARRQGDEPHAQASPGGDAGSSTKAAASAPALAPARPRHGQDIRTQGRRARHARSARRGDLPLGHPPQRRQVGRRTRATSSSTSPPAASPTRRATASASIPPNDPALAEAVRAALRVPSDFPIGGKPIRDALIEDYCAWPRARCAVRADRPAGRRRAAPEGQGAGRRRRPRRRRGNARRAGGAREVRARAPRPRSVPRVPGAAAAAPLLDLLLAAGNSGRGAPDRRCRALCVGGRQRLGVASTFLADRLEPGVRVKAYIQKAHGFALPADGATPDHHGRPRHRRRSVPLVPPAPQGDRAEGPRLAVLRPSARGRRLLLSR